MAPPVIALWACLALGADVWVRADRPPLGADVVAALATAGVAVPPTDRAYPEAATDVRIVGGGVLGAASLRVTPRGAQVVDWLATPGHVAVVDDRSPRMLTLWDGALPVDRFLLAEIGAVTGGSAVGQPCAVDCGPNATCVPGTATCACHSGYVPDTFGCVDADECASRPCGPHATCTDQLGGFTCACDAGLDWADGVCTDGDACALQVDDCDPLATCTDEEPGWSCACPDGYDGDGTVCTNVDECDAGTATCHDDAVCSDTEGGYTCACRDGYTGDGQQCDDVDECGEGRDDCAAEATCDNLPGAYACTCPLGWDGDGSWCHEPACLDVVCEVGETCRDVADVGTCGCLDGWVAQDVGCAAVCGDGLLAVGAEACDDGAANSDDAPDACRTDCAPARCGDAVVDTGEGCDDGGVGDGDGCDAACAVEGGWVCDPGCRPDRDGDGVADDDDVCPDVPDPGQVDTDGDGVGDACQRGDTAETGETDDTEVGDDTASDDDRSCGCTHGGPRGGWLLLPLVALARRRRVATARA